jgi:drug/metabolite transporter (DMT)-like permease
VAALLALLSSGMWGTADYLGGRLSRSRWVVLVLLVSQAFGLLFMVVLATLTGAWPVAGETAVPAVLASLTGGGGLLLYYRALATGVMGVVAPIASLGVLVPLVVGVLGGERVTAVQGAGIALALVGVLFASGPELHGETGWRPVGLAFGAAVLFGVSLVCIAWGSETSVTMTMTGMRLTTVLLLGLGVLASRRPIRVRAGELPAFAAVGVLDVGANLTYGLATTQGLLMLAGVFGSLYPVVTILLARFVDDERLRPIQQVGVVLCLAGVAAISAG